MELDPLVEAMTLLDEIKEKISNDDYVKLTDMIKDAREVLEETENSLGAASQKLYEMKKFYDGMLKYATEAMFFNTDIHIW